MILTEIYRNCKITQLVFDYLQNTIVSTRTAIVAVLLSVWPNSTWKGGGEGGKGENPRSRSVRANQCIRGLPIRISMLSAPYTDFLRVAH